MAKPSFPLEIWAYEDQILPNSHKQNKMRPIDDLWRKGWDKGQKPSCEELNYLLNMMATWAKYISEDQIPSMEGRYLVKDNNLSDLLNVEVARKNLGIVTKAETDARYVKITGDTMAGPLGLQRINFAAAETDAAWIETTISPDKTLLDFCLMDNVGSFDDGGTSTVDAFRWRFQPTQPDLNPEFTLMHLNAISVNRALLKVIGNIEAQDNVRSNTVTITGTASFGNVSISSQLTTGSFYANGGSNVDNMTVRGQYCVVGGRNVVRSVNGVNADGNGNLTIHIPASGVQDIRCGGMLIDGVADNRVRPGYVMRGWANGNKKELRGAGYWAAPLQKLVNGQWITVQTL